MHGRISPWGYDPTRKCGELVDSLLNCYLCQDGSFRCQPVKSSCFVPAGFTPPVFANSLPLSERSQVPGKLSPMNKDLRTALRLFIGIGRGEGRGGSVVASRPKMNEKK
jgi:hypothetical protein